MVGVVGPEGMAGVWMEEDDKEGNGERDEKERMAFAGRRFLVKGGSTEREEHHGTLNLDVEKGEVKSV